MHVAAINARTFEVDQQNLSSDITRVLSISRTAVPDVASVKTETSQHSAINLCIT